MDDRLKVDPAVLADYPPLSAKPEFKLPNWAEAVIFVTILFGGMFWTRRRNYSIFRGDRHSYTTVLDRPSGDPSAEEELMGHSSSDNDEDQSINPMPEKQTAKKRTCCGLCTIHTPSTSRFKNHFHSRLFQKFPFVVEQLYWVLNYLFYRMTTVLSNKIFAGEGIWTAARSHALAILDLEHFSWLSFLFPVKELDIQQWFLHGHQDALTFLDRFYALIHIPGSMFFIVWYYYVAPSHATFATVRRTITLTNFMAFCTCT